MSNKININKGQGGLGRPLAGEDFISGILFQTSALPSGFATSSRIKEIFSVEEAEKLGITDTHIGETKATSVFTVSNGGVNGDTITLYVDGIQIANYTGSGAGTGTASVGIASAINAGTLTHGYSATGAVTSSATFSIVSPAGSGIAANSYAVSTSSSGTLAGSASSFTGGVSSTIDVLHYHISEYFRAQPKGDLYVGIYPPSSDFAEITAMQNYSGGKIRQFGVYTQTAFATSMTNALQAIYNANNLYYKPLQIILQADFSGVTDLSTLPDLHLLTNGNVSVCIGQDGGATGYKIWKASGKSVGIVGITLGAVSYANVNENIAWVNKFQMSTSELDTLAFANGTAYQDLSDGAINNIDSKGYIFLLKQIGIAGSYFNDSYTCVSIADDYAYIENNRTIDKAARSIRTYLLPTLSSPVEVNPDGTLTEDVCAYFQSLAGRGLDTMIRASEISAYEVIIDPNQNFISTSELIMTVKIVPVGVARVITVNLGFATNL